MELFDKNSMIFAGPGTGKTRIITSRIAYLFEADILPDSKKILAITFTNKASNEMKTRVKLFGVDNKRIRIGTFHNFCLWVLKAYGDKINLNRDFTFISTNQQIFLLRQIIKDTNMRMKPFDLKNSLSSFKNASVDYSDYLDKTRTGAIGFHEAAMEYQKRLYENNLIDYDDAILHTATLFKAKPGILKLYQNAFPYILVDEMQDTNTMQLELIRLLGSDVKHVMAVADDDQSIYGWRGALPSVIQDYIHLLEADTIVLRNNYRSPQKVLNLANQLIQYNNGRTEKELIGRPDEPGDTVQKKQFNTCTEEAEWVANKIDELHTQGIEYRQMIILYRNRHPSLKKIDEKLVEKGIPFQHFGKNFTHKELLTEYIVTAMKLVAEPLSDIIIYALLTLIARRFYNNDDFDLYEFYNEGLNGVTLEKLAAMDAADEIDEFVKVLASFCLKTQKTSVFINLYEGLYQALGIDLSLQKLDEITKNEEKRHLDMLKDRVSKSLATNITELLAEIDLQDDSNHIDQESNRVGVSTFHTAKGLEYKVVFIIALEDQFVPGRNRGIADKEQEERRGLYVAITRSESKLFLTCAKHRTNWNGVLEQSRYSRFFEDMKDTVAT